MSVRLIHGDCLDVLHTFEECSVDSIVTDPPYELGFMGKKWDASGIAYNVEMWRQCLRVLKPGGHLLAFGGTRTYHRMTVAIEDAGFEIRDSIHWLYGSGFPKSLDVSKAIDKAAGAERQVIGSKRLGGNAAQSTKDKGGTYASNTNSVGVAPIDVPVTAPATEAAQKWDGWGTALKPAHEPIVLARKPLVGTVAANVLEHGTGALNIDGTRVGDETVTINTFDNGAKPWGNAVGEPYTSRQSAGRWPANVIIDDSISDDWARYFYCAKTSKRERNAGLDSNNHPTVKPLELMRYLVRLAAPPEGTVLDPFAGSGTTLMAATLEGCDSIGIELTEEYLPIIESRVAWAEAQRDSTICQQGNEPIQGELPI